MVTMMWFKREPKVPEKVDTSVVNKLRRKKPSLLKPTRESSERETSADSDKERRRYSDILDMKASLERRDESDESLYESADGHSDTISVSDDALPRLGKTPTLSKESLKLAVTDEESDTKMKKGHRKAMSLSNPLEVVKNFGDEWFDYTKKDVDKNFDKKKSRESLWSEDDKDSIHGSNMKLNQIRKNSKKDKNSEDKKGSSDEAPKRKTSKGSSVSALNFLRRKKAPASTKKSVEAVIEDDDANVNPKEIIDITNTFLKQEKTFAQVFIDESDSDTATPPPKVVGEHRRRLSRQTSRSKSKVRGKSVKVNTLRKSHSGTLKKGKKKSVKTPLPNRSRQTSIVETNSPLEKKKSSEMSKQSSWLFSAPKGETKREGSAEEPLAPEIDVDSNDAAAKEVPEKEHNWRGAGRGAGRGGAGRGVNRAESCRERDAPRRGKHRNASDPNRLTAHHNHDLEPGAPTAPSGSSSSSSLSSKSNESNTVAADHQGSQSDWSEEEDPLAAQWSDSLPPYVKTTIILSARLRKRQEVIHELIVSEGSHVRWLKVLGVDFLKPLERQPSLLPAEDLRALFPNLPSVRDRHAKLYSELRAARNAATNFVVQIRPVADAILNTLGEPGYAACLSKFCQGQRMALEALRERRRKHKELQQFLAGREQLPRCGRLQLRDLLAVVWQRLTKYQLLLEGILKTVCIDDDSEPDSDEDVAQLKRALTTAKEVLHSVDTAIRTAENDHRLRSIQSKLEVRVGGLGAGEAEELRRLELPARRLRLEGELALRTDSKKMSVLALMLEDCLVLLQREGDKFLLKPITQPSQNGLLSPVIKWDKVLFRPNAAVRNTFFLMNINGIQMHELSANTPAEYATWVKHIQESRLAETKPVIPQPHSDHHGTNVSRNPSDASEKSAVSDVTEEREKDIEDTEVEVEAEGEMEGEREREKEEQEKEKKKEEESEKTGEADADKPEEKLRRRSTVGRICTHGSGGGGGAPLEPSSAVRVLDPPAPVLTAAPAYSNVERLRRLDAGIGQALRAKAAVAAELLGLPHGSFDHVAEIAADELGHMGNHNSDADQSPDIHQLLLVAQAQANQLTELISAAMSVSEAEVVAARAGGCDRCRTLRLARPAHPAPGPLPATHSAPHPADPTPDHDVSPAPAPAPAAEPSPEPELDLAADFGGLGAAGLARRAAGPAAALQAALGALLAALPPLERERGLLRRELCAARERAHRADYLMTEEMFLSEDVDQSIQDHPSNGG